MNLPEFDEVQARVHASKLLTDAGLALNGLEQMIEAMRWQHDRTAKVVSAEFQVALYKIKKLIEANREDKTF